MKISELIDNATDLEQAILEAEEVRDKIEDKIARARRYIELNTTERPATPIIQPQSVPQLDSADHPRSNIGHHQ